jgi:sensitive to high expression protein 9
LQEEMAEGKGSSEPALDAVVACIKGEQEEKASLDTAEMHLPTELMKLRKLDTWTSAVQDLFSDRIIEMRKQEVTIVALEGAAMGAAIVTIIATLLLRPS